MSQKPNDGLMCQQCPDRQRVCELERLLAAVPAQQSPNSAVVEIAWILRDLVYDTANGFQIDSDAYYKRIDAAVDKLQQ